MSWILDLSILLSISCVYICSADDVELPVPSYLLSMFGISHAVQNEKKLWTSHIQWSRVIGEVLVLGTGGV